MMTTGARVARLRKQAGLTQQELADRAGIERSKISRIEKDGRRITSTEVLYLAQALGATTGELLGTSEAPALSRYRGGSEKLPERARQTAAWFRHFVDDAIFVERTARRYGVE